MTAIFIVKDTNIKFELDNFTVTQKIPTETEITDNMKIRKPAGKIITFITSNMPPVLQKEIDELIEHYCNS